MDTSDHIDKVRTINR